MGLQRRGTPGGPKIEISPETPCRAASHASGATRQTSASWAPVTVWVVELPAVLYVRGDGRSLRWVILHQVAQFLPVTKGSNLVLLGMRAVAIAGALAFIGCALSQSVDVAGATTGLTRRE